MLFRSRLAGVLDRFSSLAGNAFEIEFEGDHDVVLIPNFLHHFSPADCVRFLRKAHGALRAGGTVAIVEFVPDADRISPRESAGFSIVMLATTPEGDAYTFEEFAAMLSEAGFLPPSRHVLPSSPNVALIAMK